MSVALWCLELITQVDPSTTTSTHKRRSSSAKQQAPVAAADTTSSDTANASSKPMVRQSSIAGSSRSNLTQATTMDNSNTADIGHIR
jgi:uncharacterized protein with WD repeat